jgi:hypothetical protein
VHLYVLTIEHNTTLHGAQVTRNTRRGEQRERGHDNVGSKHNIMFLPNIRLDVPVDFQIGVDGCELPLHDVAGHPTRGKASLGERRSIYEVFCMASYSSFSTSRPQTIYLLLKCSIQPVYSLSDAATRGRAVRALAIHVLSEAMHEREAGEHTYRHSHLVLLEALKLVEWLVDGSEHLWAQLARQMRDRSKITHPRRTTASPSRARRPAPQSSRTSHLPLVSAAPAARRRAHALGP